jgi:hypothetical protein
MSGIERASYGSRQPNFSVTFSLGPISFVLWHRAVVLPSVQASQAPSPVSEQWAGAKAESKELLALLPAHTVEALQAHGESVDAAFLQRWLKARGNVAEAAAAIETHAQWRQLLIESAMGGHPAGTLPSPMAVLEEALAGELSAGKAFILGLDRGGRPVILFRPNLLDPSTPLDTTIRLLCYTMDKAMRTADLERNPAGQLCCLFDLQGGFSS